MGLAPGPDAAFSATAPVVPVDAAHTTAVCTEKLSHGISCYKLFLLSWGV